MKKYLLFSSILILAGLTNLKICAASITWTGNHSNNWNHFENWSPMIVPNNSDDVTIPASWVNEIVINGANASCKTLSYNGSGFGLKIENGWEFIIAGDLNISGNSTITGLGGIEVIGGNNCYLNLAAQTTVSVNHINIKSTSNVYLTTDLNMPNGRIDIFSGNFITHGNDLVVNSISIVQSSVPRGLNIDNSTVTSYTTNLFILNGGSFLANHSVVNNRFLICTDGNVSFDVINSFHQSTIVTTQNNAHIGIQQLNSFGDINIGGDPLHQGQTFTIVSFNIIKSPAIIKLSPEPCVTGYYIYSIQAPSGCDGEILLTDESEVGNNQIQMYIIGGAYFEKASVANVRVVSGSMIVNNGMDIGNNSGIVFNQSLPHTFYWINGGGSWKDGNHWSNTSGGSPSGCVPGLKDHVIINNASGFSVNDTILLEEHTFCNNLIADQGIVFKPVIKTGSTIDLTLNVAGDFDLRGFEEFKVLYKIFFRNKNNSKIYTGGHAILEDIYFTNIGSSELKDDLNCKEGTKGIHQYAGHFITNGNSITTSTFISKGVKMMGTARELSIEQSTIHMGHVNLVGGNVIVFADSLDLYAANSEFIFEHLSNQGGQFKMEGFKNLSFYNITFLNQVSNSRLVFNKTSSFNRIYFHGNGSIVGADNVILPEMSTIDTLLITGKYRYEIEENTRINIRKKMKNVYGLCNELAIIQSTSLANKAFLHSSSLGGISIENVWIENIEASGFSLPFLAINSVNGGNNLNFNFPSFNVPQVFFWNGEATNTLWSNGQNWNIGMEAHPGNSNDIFLYNPNGCIPGYNDSVVFQIHSFPVADTVTINENANFRGMNWMTGSGNNRILAGNNQFSLNNYGGLEFDNQLHINFSGELIFRSPHAQQLYFRGVVYPGVITFYNLGKYLLRDQLSCTGYSLRLLSGSFDSGGKNIFTNTLIIRHEYAPSTSNNVIKLDHSQIDIALSFLGNFIEGVSSLHASNSNIKLYSDGASMSVMGNCTNVSFGSVNFVSPVGNVGLFSYYHNGITRPHFRNVNFETSGIIMGENSIDTLTLAEGKEYQLENNTTQYVNDLLYSKGSPCYRTTITSTLPGSRAFIQNQNCRLLVEHARIRDIEGIIGSCGANNYQVGVGGEDMGNNLNWYFIPGNPINGLGNDTTLSCKTLPYTQTTLGFGAYDSIIWDDGTNSNIITIDTINTISATVIYSPSCIINDGRTFNFNSNIEQMATIHDITCYGENNGSIQLEIVDVDSVYNQTWIYPDNQIRNSTNDITNLKPGTYSSIVTVPGYELMCNDTAYFTINEPELLTVTLDTTIFGKCSDPDGIIMTSSAGGTGEHVYEWNNGNTLPNNYSAWGGVNTLIVSDTNGCTAQLSVELGCIEHLNIPELVTPNGDGYSDEWEIIDLLRLYPDNDVKIMNRWGNTVYHLTGYHNEFTGIPNTGDTLSKGYLPSGTYFYVIDLGKGYKTLTGYIELVY